MVKFLKIIIVRYKFYRLNVLIGAKSSYFVQDVLFVKAWIEAS